jgi:hypothetical protein
VKNLQPDVATHFAQQSSALAMSAHAQNGADAATPRKASAWKDMPWMQLGDVTHARGRRGVLVIPAIMSLP